MKSVIGNNVKKMIFIERSKKFSESPKFFQKEGVAREIKFLVLHHVQADSVEHAIAQFKQHEVSSHFLIDEDGKIFELVDENDVAYHAGVSFWAGVDGLNKNSIGVEFINSEPFLKKFTKEQMQAGIELCRYLIEKYKIEPKNIVGHSDIAYSKKTGLPDRKQDPSHLFDWKFLAENGVGIFPKISSDSSAESEKSSLKNGKEMLKKFGYKVENINNDFDPEMQALARVFNRRFLNRDSAIWDEKFQRILFALIKT
jgi:N-acetylmuramoyl-L-alanine amidase